MDPATLLLAGGSLASGLGSALGRSTGRDQRAATQLARQDILGQQTLLGDLFFGPGWRDAWAEANYSAVDAIGGRPDAYVAGGPGNGQGGGAGASYRQRIGRVIGGPDVMTALRNQGETAMGEFNNALGGFRADTTRLAEGDQRDREDVDRAYAGVTDEARRYGSRTAGVLRQEAGERVREMDGAAMGALARRGLSNTSAIGNQLSENRRVTGIDLSRSLADLERSVTDRVLQAGGARASAFERSTATMSGRRYARATQDTALGTENAGRNYAIRTRPLETLLNVQQGNVMSPYSGGSVPRQAGVTESGTANLLQTLGNAAAGFGAQQYGADQQTSRMAQILAMLQQGGGGSSLPYAGRAGGG